MLFEDYLNLVTKHLWRKNKCMHYFRLFLVNFLDLEIIQLIISRKKFLFDSKFWDVFLSSAFRYSFVQ